MDNIDVFDKYEFYLDGFFYTPSRIPGPGAPFELDECFKYGCYCENCSSDSNNCHNGQNYCYESGQTKLTEKAIMRDLVVMECHNGCNCRNIDLSVYNNNLTEYKKNTLLRCHNRCIQFGPFPGLEVFQTDHKGLGLKTGQPISKHEFICEYAGEVIGFDEAHKRLISNNEQHRMNYVFILNEHTNDTHSITCVDPSQFGNIGRFINHSCSPNAKVIPIRVSSPIPHLCIFAIDDIAAGEEIVFDYGGGTSFGSSEKSSTTCCCGSAKCQKVLPGLV